MNLTFAEKKQLIIENEFSLKDLKQIIAEIEEGEAESQADDMTISDFVFLQQKLEATP